jgi:hypothetical protein
MSAFDFDSLLAYVGHKVSVVCYRKDGDPANPVCNVAIECEDCSEVLLDYDNPEWGDDDRPVFQEPPTPVDVLIRVWNDRMPNGDPDIFALMPYIPATDNLVTCYQQSGGHAGADYGRCIAESRPATPKEAAPLLKALQNIGYAPRVIGRVSRRRMRAAFAA